MVRCVPYWYWWWQCYPCLLSGVRGVDGFDCGLDERDRERDNDCIAIPPQESYPAELADGKRTGLEAGLDFSFRKAKTPQTVQLSGKPISHLLWLAFNAARFPVPAVEDVEVAPSCRSR